MIVQELWQRARQQCQTTQTELIQAFRETEHPLSKSVVSRLLQGERQPNTGAHHVVPVLLRFFGQRRLLYDEDEVEALGRWFHLPPGAALGLMPRVAFTNLDVAINPQTFQKPQRLYHHILERLGQATSQHIALVGPPGIGKTTLACHLGLNPLIGSWYDAVLHARSRQAAGWQPENEVALLETLNEFIWTLDPEHSAAENPTVAQAILRRLLRGKRALFILDDVADVEVLPRLFVRGKTNSLLAVAASGTALQDAALHFLQVELEGWSNEEAHRYVSDILKRELPTGAIQTIDALNEWIRGLPLLWSALAELLFYESDWPDLVEELAVAGLEMERVQTVLKRLLVRLPLAETHLLETWGVFAPHAPVDAAALAYVANVEKREARTGLRSLHRRRLLRFSQGRFELHPLFGRFAAERLAGDGRLETCAERHARFYADRIRPLRDEQNSPAWTGAVQRLLPDLPNVRLGQAWAAAHGHPLTVDYFLNLAPYQVAIRDLESDRAWGLAALPLVEADPTALPLLDRLTFYAQAPASSPDEQRAYLGRALAIIREEMSEEPTAYRIYGLCWLARFLYDEAGSALEAEPVLVEALALAAASGYPDLEIHVLAEAARFFLLLRDWAALEAIAERLPVEPPAMHPAGLSGNYYHTLRAETLRQVGRWAEAKTAYNHVLDLYDVIGDQRQGAVFRLRRALCRARLGDVEGTEADLAWVRERLTELPWAVQVRYQLTLGELALERDDVEGALAALRVLPEGWEEDADLALDAWLLWRQVHLARDQEAAAGEAEEQARAVAQARGFVLWLEEAGRDQTSVETSLAPVLLAQIVGGRPPLR